MLNNMKELFDHMQWADALVWNSVLKLPEIINDLHLKELLYHIHTVQHAYLLMWLNQPLELPKSTDFDGRENISKWGQEYYERLEKYLDGIDESSLEENINIPWENRIEKLLGKPPSPATLGQTMLQVISHSTYHRGQVNKVIRDLSGDPPLVDFISWIWSDKPHPEWPGH